MRGVRAVDIELQLELDPQGVGINLHDWGAPMRRAGGPDGPLPATLAPVARLASDVRLINLADDGKRVAVHLVATHADAVVGGGADGAADTDRGRRAQTRDDVVIRDAEPADAEAIAKLLWHGYVLGYRHRDFYRPVWIEQAMRDGRVLSTVACADGAVIGHHAVMVTAPDAAAESGVALIDRAWRGLGLFDPMFDHTPRPRTRGGPARAVRASDLRTPLQPASGAQPRLSRIRADARRVASGDGPSPVGQRPRVAEAGRQPRRESVAAGGPGTGDDAADQVCGRAARAGGARRDRGASTRPECPAVPRRGGVEPERRTRRPTCASLAGRSTTEGGSRACCAASSRATRRCCTPTWTSGRRATRW